MGYSSRYHAASLAAVFLALAVGILIGVGFGDSVVSGTEKDLSASLKSDIEQAQDEADELGRALERERQFANRAFPALVGERLAGRRIGVLAFGDFSAELATDLESTIEPAGGTLAEVSVVKVPVDARAMLVASGLPKSAPTPERMRELGAEIGRQLARGGGGLLDRTRDALYARSSGEGGLLGSIVLSRPAPDDPESPRSVRSEALISGIVEGARDSGITVVAVEREDIADSTVPFFSGLQITTVDNLDATAGKVALVFALLGAEGNFGVKATAQSLLPELLVQGRRGGG